ncbi:MAG TPA: FliM/FliN family flagellar motor switch protein [Candidatus Limnocylindria bacterium]|nr:FliM/FliN family flagellar motor switch protein [Candidatus Limnocylindria bacterium]
MDSTDNIALGQEVLSQSEVENLLAQVAESESKTVIHQSDGAKTQQSKDSVQPYDFRHPVYLSALELRKLRLHHEEFIRSLAARLSIHLRVEFSLQMSQLSTLTFQRFTESLPNPSHIVLFKTEPLRGISILHINSRLGLTVVDRLMGGPGHSLKAERDLSEIEVALLDQVVHIILGEWCSHWTGIMEMRHSILAHESNARFLNTSPWDSVMLCLSLEARIGDCTEQMQFGLPYPTIEPLVRLLNRSVDPSLENAAAIPQSPPRWRPEMEEVEIPVTAELPGRTMTTGQLARLKVGDTLDFDRDLLNRVQVRLADLHKFSGRLGSRGGKWAIEVTQVTKT